MGSIHYRKGLSMFIPSQLKKKNVQNYSFIKNKNDCDILYDKLKIIKLGITFIRL